MVGFDVLISAALQHESCQEERFTAHRGLRVQPQVVGSRLSAPGLRPRMTKIGRPWVMQVARSLDSRQASVQGSPSIPGTRLR